MTERATTAGRELVQPQQQQVQQQVHHQQVQRHSTPVQVNRGNQIYQESAF